MQMEMRQQAELKERAKEREKEEYSTVPISILKLGKVEVLYGASYQKNMN